MINQDQDEQAKAELIETAGEIRFEIATPAYSTPSVAVDIRRNGQIDAGEDFMIGVAPDRSPCLSKMIRPSVTSVCGPLGQMAQLLRDPSGSTVVTTITIPKAKISSDGVGFGFAISLFNERTRVGSSLGGGDYMFGGKLNMVTDGPNFTGQGISVPREILPFLKTYQSCLSRAVDGLKPLYPSNVGKLGSIRAKCTVSRNAALDGGVEALVAAGANRARSLAAVGAVLDRVDASFDEFIQAMNRSPAKKP